MININKIYDLLNLLIEHINDLAEKNVKEKIKEYYDSRISSLQVQIDNINYILQQKFISPQKNNLRREFKLLLGIKQLLVRELRNHIPHTFVF